MEEFPPLGNPALPLVVHEAYGDFPHSPEEEKLIEEFAPFAEILRMVKPEYRKLILIDGTDPFDLEAVAKSPRLIDRFKSKGYLRDATAYGNKEWVKDHPGEKVFEFSPEGEDSANRTLVFKDKEGKVYKRIFSICFTKDPDTGKKRTLAARDEKPVKMIDSKEESPVLDFVNEVFDLPEEIGRDWWVSSDAGDPIETPGGKVFYKDKRIGQKQYQVSATNYGAAGLIIEEVKPIKSPSNPPEVPQE